MLERGMHGQWNSNLTFLLTATGSAIGLGNIWKFPYITGEYGGSAFVLMYLVCIALVGLPIMVAETLLGRRGRLSPINGLRHVALESGRSARWQAVGYLGVMTGLLILSFYTVIAGWAMRYVWTTLSGAFSGQSAQQVGEHFNQLLQNPGAMVFWHSVFSVMTAGVVMAGVTKGLALVSRWMMPFLFAALLLLLIYAAWAGDFARGFAFMFHFEPEKLTAKAVLAALGHSFFTLSLGMGAIMAYGAYMPAQAPIGKTIVWVASLDTLVALVVGLAIFPIVFAVGIAPNSGPGLLFVSLPVAFGAMPLGALVGSLFFMLVAVAAWSSAVSIIEPGVAWLVESGRFSRFSATLALALSAWALGLLTVLSFNHLADFKPAWLLHRTFFDFFDLLTAQVLLPLGGVLMCVLVGWLMQKRVLLDELEGDASRWFPLWRFLVRFVSPLLVIWVMSATLMESLGK
jgi:neurotransmitter:Na+ symporter, NSS family